jgi:hypothetical protein
MSDCPRYMSMDQVRFTKVYFAGIPGEELTQSYFPITWSLDERRATCRTQYGFTCSCPRCLVRLCVIYDIVHTITHAIIQGHRHQVIAIHARVICRSRLHGTINKA